eukprot:gene34444-31792_t
MWGWFSAKCVGALSWYPVIRDAAQGGVVRHTRHELRRRAGSYDTRVTNCWNAPPRYGDELWKD